MNLELRNKVLAALGPPKTPPGLEGVVLPSDWYPDYPGDLNAMHEAEKALTEDEWGKYLSYIMVAAGDPSIKATVHATASQKAEAFIYAKNL